ncbi:MAG TPA: thiamine pyrophosphate-binding protein, partial [Nodosilinea sp.]|nr:thiamine pyrophosphate-binding protein [Nodosilinea sp.]
MGLDFRTTNALWASVLAATLARLGLRTAVVSPGSRSTPLTMALAGHPDIEVVPVLDERSAGFFALGVARRTGLPVVLVCTSGTAGANYYPAVIEAKESRVPLLVLTADRPPELRACASGQTIDQQRLFGAF